MARPLRITYPGAFYHVTSRGNEQKDVFKSQRDREKFLDYLASATERYVAVIHASGNRRTVRSWRNCHRRSAPPVVEKDGNR